MAVPKGTQLFGERTLADAIEAIPDVIDAVRGIKFTQNARVLAQREIKIAKSVFKKTIDYSRVYVSDGLGLQGRPYTIPVPMTNPRKYMIYVGEQGYTGMSFLQSDKNLLIHELTHVWQGMQSTWAWTVQGSSLYHQARGNAYDYDKANYIDWDDYNPEQQAEIVEDWFERVSPGTNKDDLDESIDDPRYRYIVENIRGETMPIVTKPHEETSMRSSTTQKEPPVALTDSYLVEILKVRYAADDVAGFGGRARKLEQLFGSLKAAQAIPLLTRLELRRPGDQVAMYFHGHLSTATRDKLLAILRGRLMAF
jgi:hypothetical protein